jgi:hypothetical protein
MGKMVRHRSSRKRWSFCWMFNIKQTQCDCAFTGLKPSQQQPAGIHLWSIAKTNRTIATPIQPPLTQLLSTCALMETLISL